MYGIFKKETGNLSLKTHLPTNFTRFLKVSKTYLFVLRIGSNNITENMKQLLITF